MVSHLEICLPDKPPTPKYIDEGLKGHQRQYYKEASFVQYDTPGSLVLQQYPKNHVHNSDLLNLIPFELDITYNPFSNTKILTYEIELPPDGKKIGFNLLDDEDFTIPYVTDTIPNSPADHKLPTQDQRNVWINDIK